MFYYHVWVRSEQYRGNDPLTYKYPADLVAGTLVQVPLRELSVEGFVSARVRRPAFPVKAVSAVHELPALPATTVQMARWLQRFYISPVGIVSGQFLPNTIHDQYIKHLRHAETQPVNVPALPPVTAQQADVLKAIDKPDTYLLHGRTGSGKTRIYLELALQTLKEGKSALILCPEIGLTSQLTNIFRAACDSPVIILHSQLTAKEREIAWLEILQSARPIVVIGPRSALFSPIHNLGLIVVDEFHDQAYKQEQPPYYQAVRVASQLRTLCNATLVLGSATPSVTDYFIASQKHKTILRLDALAKPSVQKRHITIVDLKDRSLFPRASHLSLPLVQAMSDSLNRHEQVLLYLNRRGTARVTLCDICGWQALCPHCDLPLTYHGDTFMLQCHICGRSMNPPRNCPTCNNASITFHSFGTKAIVKEVEQLFPEARILRLDTDSKKAERLESQYQTIIDKKVDILVGTQLLTKGLDLPGLSTLGVILADSSLYLPDFTASERTYQLLTQVIGRIGRGHLESHAIIQTYNPASGLLQAAIHDKWADFYKNEIAERRHYSFPPFYSLLKLSCRRKSAKSAEKAAELLKQKLASLNLDIIIEGPAPAFHERTGDHYKWQLVVKSRDRNELLRVINILPAGWGYDIDPQDLL